MSNDDRYKHLFSSKEIIIEFLKYFTLENLDQQLELDSLEMKDSQYSIRKGDQVWKAKFKNNQTIYFLLMLEHQSKIDYSMPIRIATYTGELYQKLADELDFKKGFLPFILPIVIYNGKRRWNAKTNLQSMYNQSVEYEKLKKYQLNQEYLLLDISRIDYRNIPDSLFKYLFELESGNLLDQSVIDVLKKLAELNYSSQTLDLISYFVKSAFQKNYKILYQQVEQIGDIMTIADTFEREVQQIQRSSKLEGLEQGLSQGISQGKLETAKNLILLNVDLQIVMQSTGLTLEQLKEHGLISEINYNDNR